MADVIGDALEAAVAATRLWLDGYVGADDEAVRMFEAVVAEARVSDLVWACCLLWFSAVNEQGGEPEIDLESVALAVARDRAERG